MGRPHLYAGREHELRALIHNADSKSLHDQLGDAACRGMDPDAFHPDEGPPDDHVIDRCTRCEARLACVALALRAEDPDMRSGWYGGLGPDDRDDVAGALGLENPKPQVPERAAQVARLRAAGWTVDAIAIELGCSRRTVQRQRQIVA